MPWRGKPFGWKRPRPLLDFLPEPVDATTNLLRQITEPLAEGREVGEVKVSLNYLEPPSNLLAAELQFRAYNSPAKLRLKIGSVPRPDPRRGAAKFALWKYRFKKASPAVPPPPSELMVAIGRLASAEYDFEGGWRSAEEVATQLSPFSVEQILAVMVHPPAISDGEEAWIWLQRVQLAAAQVAAHREIAAAVDLGDSLVRAVALGPVDWTIDAAIIALTQWARADESQIPAARSLFLGILKHKIPTAGAWGFVDTLLQCWLLLPHVPPQEQAQLREWIAEREAAE